jgi:hypothetical protein
MSGRKGGALAEERRNGFGFSPAGYQYMFAYAGVEGAGHLVTMFQFHHFCT